MFIDLVLLFVFIVVAASGFFQGTIKIVIALITFYASILLSSLYFKFLASAFTRRGTNTLIADAVSFFLILAVAFAILLAAGLYTFRYVRLPGRLEIADRVMGVVLGVVLGIVVTSILAMILQYLFISHDTATQTGYPIARMLQRSTRGSALLPLMLTTVLPQLYTLVAPLLPDAAQPFFNPSRR